MRTCSGRVGATLGKGLGLVQDSLGLIRDGVETCARRDWERLARAIRFVICEKTHLVEFKMEPVEYKFM